MTDRESGKTSLLEVSNLNASFKSRQGDVTAVVDVSFQVRKGEVVSLVGESGSGKSTVALSLLGLIRPPHGITSGKVLFGGRNVLQMGRRELRRFRGRSVSMVFQDPLSSLNPSLTIGRQLAEALRLDLRGDHRAIKRRASELLTMVGLPDPAIRLRDFPHQLSGGMRQRVLIALALAREPQLVIADEITTALDVTVQAQILELLAKLTRDLDLAVLLITHDLGVVANVADRVHVMYAGQLVESATTTELFVNPQMPYTCGLLGSSLRLDQPRAARLQVIGGQPPDLMTPPTGCRFEPRCIHARTICREQPPQLKQLPTEPPGHDARCWGLESGIGWISSAEPARVQR